MSLVGITSSPRLGKGQDPPKFRVAIEESEPVSWSYRVALIAVAGGVMALPVIYLTLVAGLAWAVYFHFTQHYRWLMQDPTIWVLVLYVGIGLIGLALI